MLSNVKHDHHAVKLHVVTKPDIDNKKLLKQKCLLAFERVGTEISGKTSNGIFELSFDDATRNVLVLGGTGQGKTESILKPAADRLISSGCAGLILDAKNDYAFLEDLHPDQVVRLSLYRNTCINLIGGIDTSVLRAILENFRKAYASSEPYWGMAGVEDALLIFLYYKSIGKSPTLADIYNGLTKPKMFCLQLERFLLITQSIPAELARQIEYRLSDPFSLLWVGEFQDKEPKSSRVDEQYAWQTNAIKKILSPFENNTSLKQTFCADDNIDFNDLIYSQRKTLILDINPDLLPDASQAIGQIMRVMFMHCVSSSNPSQRRLQGYGEHCYTFMLIDEYQQFINTESHSSLRDDNSWLDRSRAYGHINILATQSINSLLARSEMIAANTIIQNCQTTICLPTTDSVTLSRVSKLTGSLTTVNEYTYALLHSTAIGNGFIHIANHAQSKHGVLCGMFKAGNLADPEYHFMSYHIGSNHTFPARPAANNAQSLFTDNKFRKDSPHIEFLTGNIILISTNENSVPNLLSRDILSISGVKSIEHKTLDAYLALSQADIDYFELIIEGDIIIFTSLPKTYSTDRFSSTINIPYIFEKAKEEGAIALTCCIDNSPIEYLREAYKNFSTEQDLLDELKQLFSSLSLLSEFLK